MLDRLGKRAGKRHARTRSPRLFLSMDETLYAIRPIPVDGAGPTRIFRLNKFDGTAYDVVETVRGPQCDCPDFIFRREGIDPGGCKHVRALVAYGLIQNNVLPHS
jgi:hypothetical protein